MGASSSSEKFRESVYSLIQEDVSPDDSEFWDELWKIPSSAEEVFKLISPNAARRLRDERFDNLATLFTQAVAQLCQIVETPYNVYFDQALNCVRVLTRILPFLLEKGDLGDADPNVEHLCWGTRTDTGSVDQADESQYGCDPFVGKVIGGEDSDDLSDTSETRDGKNQTGVTTSYEEDPQEPLALLVMHAAMHMLFLPQFTCDFYEDSVDKDFVSGDNSTMLSKIKRGTKCNGGSMMAKMDEDDDFLPEEIDNRQKNEIKPNDDNDMRIEAGLGSVKYVESGISLLPRPTSMVWAAGCGVHSNQLCTEGRTRKFDKNRIEVLRLLLAACCDPLFSPSDEYNPLASRWLEVAVAVDAPNTICLFYSLLNTILSCEPKGISVPYSSSFVTDTHFRLVELSAQVLCVLLDCGLSGSPHPVKSDYGIPVIEFKEVSKVGFNIFRTILARIDSGFDLNHIYNGFSRLLKNTYESKSIYLPQPSKSIRCFQEVLIIFWKMLEENPFFMNHILTRCDITEIIVPICFLMYQSRKDPTQIGLVHICTFAILKLSGERSFGVNLNKPFNTRLPCDFPLFSGGHSDLICITLHKLIVNGSFKLVPLYSCFLTVICNISPYWRSMSLVAAVKIVNLFELFSSPKFLYSGKNSYQHLSLLLEVFNNMIQYQFNGNPHLIYAIIRRKDSFGRLISLTLPKVISQCNKVYGNKNTVECDTDAPEKREDCTSVSSVVLVNDEEQNASQMTVEQDPSYFIKEHDSGQVSLQPTNRDDFTHNSSIVGNAFEPSEEWLSELKENMPLATITKLLQYLVPIVDDIVDRKDGSVDETEILEVLKEVTMVGLLPVPHAIVVRKYQPNQYTSLWFTTFLWGVIFVMNQNPPIFDGDSIELFQVSSTKRYNNVSIIS